MIVGAGLAGCATASALAEQGRSSTLLEHAGAIATAGSGNAAGVFHGVVHASDGRHARFNRAAALEAGRAVRIAIERHGVAGGCGGLLRLARGGAGRAELAAIVARLGLPEDYARAVSADEASALAGSRIDAPAWYYPDGGWVDPRGLARAYLERAGASAALRLGTSVAALRRDGEAWALADASGAVVAHADIVVLANAGGALELLGADWPVRRVRGQVSAISADGSARPGLPGLPLAGSGYVVPARNGRLWFGATAQPDDADASIRASDDTENLRRLAALLPDLATLPVVAARTGFRWSSDDRLPLIGAVAAATYAGLSSAATAAGPGRFDQPRLIERAAGLFVFAALGSRGIAWSALGAQALAAGDHRARPRRSNATCSTPSIRPASSAGPGAAQTRGPARGPDQPPLGPIAGGSAGR